MEDRAVDEKAEGPPCSLASEVPGILKKKKKKDNKDFFKRKKKKIRPSATQTLTIPTVCEGETEQIIAPGHVRPKQVFIPITLAHVHKTICSISAAVVQGPGW